MRNHFSFIVFIILVISCRQKDSVGDISPFNTDSLAKNISVLSSDEFQGRKPFTEGEDKTINYLKNQFAALGVEPGNGNSYFQEVPMVNIATEPDSIMRVQAPKGNYNLKGFDDYVIWTEKTDSIITLANDELVFCRIWRSSTGA